jgi:hypothetical protein
MVIVARESRVSNKLTNCPSWKSHPPFVHSFSCMKERECAIFLVSMITLLFVFESQSHYSQQLDNLHASFFAIFLPSCSLVWALQVAVPSLLGSTVMRFELVFIYLYHQPS